MSLAADTSASNRSDSDRENRSTRTRHLVEQLRRTDDTDRAQLLDELVRVNMCVAASIAARYRGRGIPDDDLEQVAYVALVRSARGFDPDRGHDFLAFAVPSIRGQVRRYFRDHGWMVQPPRKIQELKALVTAETSDLATELGRVPTAAELAERVDHPVAEVEEALASNTCFRPASLDVPSDRSAAATLGDLLGMEDRNFDTAEARTMLAPLVRNLKERDRTIVLMRFVEDATQREIAEAIGVTQMQVSRLLRRILTAMRTELEGPSAAAGPIVAAQRVVAR